MAPAIEALLPHRAPMLLLSDLDQFTDGELLASSERALLERLLPGSVGLPLLALELMAQAAAVYAGLAAAAAVGPVAEEVGATPGMLLGSRSLRLAPTDSLSEQLLVGVALRSPLRGAGLAKFSGTVWGGASEALMLARAAAAQAAAGGDQGTMLAAVEAVAGLEWLATADVSVYLPAGA